MSKSKQKLTYGSMIYLKLDEESENPKQKDKVYFSMAEGF